MNRRGPGRRIAVVGSLNLDILVPVGHHPAPGETVLGGDSLRNPGGKGANQAVAAARLGNDVVMVGRVGDDDAGAQLVEALAADGVDTSHVEATRGAPTGIAMIAVNEGGENTIVVSPGANARVSEEDVVSASHVLAGAGVTLVQLEIPIEAVAAAARLAGGTVVLNPAPARELPRWLLDDVDVLVPNRGELAALLGVDHPKDLDELAATARSLPGPGTVVVTLGGDGALVVTSDETTHIPAFGVAVVDSTAAGDAFCGALADGLARGEPIHRAARWGAATAALAVTTKGAQVSLPSRTDVVALLAEGKGSR
jgi:ribokinase